MSEFIDAKLREARARLEELEAKTAPVVEAYEAIKPELTELEEAKFVIEKLEPFAESEVETRKPEVVEVVETPQRRDRPSGSKSKTPKASKKSSPRKKRRPIQAEMLNMLKKAKGPMELQKLYDSFEDVSSRNKNRAISNMQQRGMIEVGGQRKKTVTLLQDTARSAA